MGREAAGQSHRDQGLVGQIAWEAACRQQVLPSYEEAFTGDCGSRARAATRGVGASPTALGEPTPRVARGAVLVHKGRAQRTWNRKGGEPGANPINPAHAVRQHALGQEQQRPGRDVARPKLQRVEVVDRRTRDRQVTAR